GGGGQRAGPRREARGPPGRGAVRPGDRSRVPGDSPARRRAVRLLRRGERRGGRRLREGRGLATWLALGAPRDGAHRRGAAAHGEHTGGSAGQVSADAPDRKSVV